MMQYILDTNICVFYLRGQLRFDEFVEGNWREYCCISEVTVLELYFGAENSNHPYKHHEAVGTFLQGVSVLPVSACATVYAKEKVRFRKAGGLTPVTDNVKHFKDFENIKIANWFRPRST
jgi:tRNA(fMet)-specific endonuclease VapC